MLECEYEERCINNNKCFRCNNMNLLHLPEDKRKKRYKKKNLYNPVVAKSNNSWEDLESQIARELNALPTIKEVRRSRGSGNLWFEKGDVLDSILTLECKERKAAKKSISIKKEWLTKALEEAKSNDKTMALPFRFKEDNNIYIIMTSSDIIELVNTLKVYQHECDVQDKIIQQLKKKIRE